MRAIVIAVALALAATEAAARQGLTAPERRIVAAVDRAAPGALATLERTVNVNSGSLNFAGVREVGRLFAAQFEALGFATRWVDGAAWGRAGHLVAERHGRRIGPKILFIGHLDTVFEEDSPFQRYQRLSDSTARGPGVIDMKGGNVVMLLALRALLETGQLDRMQVTIVLIGDEESSGRPLELARADLLRAAAWADIALGFEDGDGNPATAVVGRRGYSGWTLRTSGRAAHSSQVFRADIGAGAIYEAARILSEFRDSLGGDPTLTFNPGVMLGGTSVSFDPEEARGTAFGKSNVIAESTVVAGDLRTLTLEQRSRARAVMERIAARNLPRTTATLSFSDGYPPLAPSAGNHRLLEMFDRASRDLGHGPVTAVDPARAGAADISFTAGLVEMALDGLGLMGEDGHTVNETADLRTLPVQAKRVALLLARLAARQAAASAPGP
jgi:glutamate carboxypeptidase